MAFKRATASPALPTFSEGTRIGKIIAHHGNLYEDATVNDTSLSVSLRHLCC